MPIYSDSNELFLYFRNLDKSLKNSYFLSNNILQQSDMYFLYNYTKQFSLLRKRVNRIHYRVSMSSQELYLQKRFCSNFVDSSVFNISRKKTERFYKYTNTIFRNVRSDFLDASIFNGFRLLLSFIPIALFFFNSDSVPKGSGNWFDSIPFPIRFVHEADYCNN